MECQYKHKEIMNKAAYLEYLEIIFRELDANLFFGASFNLSFLSKLLTMDLPSAYSQKLLYGYFKIDYP